MKIDICNLQSSCALNTAFKRSLTGALRRTLERAASAPGALTLCVADNRLMRELNLLYRGSASTTDCLAFDLGSQRQRSFEIVIGIEAARNNARTFGTSLLYEACLYATHGLLHLQGWDDDRQAKRAAMLEKAERILAGIPAVMKTLPPGERMRLKARG